MKEYELILAADFSLNGDSLRIFELGNSGRSGLVGLAETRKAAGLAPIEDELLAHLRGMYPEALYVEVDGFTTGCAIYDCKTGKKTFYSNHSNSRLINLIESQAHAASEGNSSFRPVIASIPNLSSFELESVRRLNLEDQWRISNLGTGCLYMASIDKAVFFEACGESALIPETLLLNLTDPELKIRLHDFLTSHPSENYVIKPTARVCGMGVCLMEASKVDEFISVASRRLKEKGLGDYNEYGGEAYWESPPSEFMLIQKACPSKKIVIGGAELIPTGRVLIRATINLDPALPVRVECLGAYWKADVLKYSNEALPISSNLSGADHIRRINGKIEDEDWCLIKTKFEAELPAILHRMAHLSREELLVRASSDCFKRYYETLIPKYFDGESVRSKVDALPLVRSADSYFDGLEYGGPGSLELKPLFRQECGGSSLISPAKTSLAGANSLFAPPPPPIVSSSTPALLDHEEDSSSYHKSCCCFSRRQRR